MVSTPLKNISQIGSSSQLLGKIKNVPNHQAVILRFFKAIWVRCFMDQVASMWLKAHGVSLIVASWILLEGLQQEQKIGSNLESIRSPQQTWKIPQFKTCFIARRVKNAIAWQSHPNWMGAAVGLSCFADPSQWHECYMDHSATVTLVASLDPSYDLRFIACLMLPGKKNYPLAI